MKIVSMVIQLGQSAVEKETKETVTLTRDEHKMWQSNRAGGGLRPYEVKLAAHFEQTIQTLGANI